jgi:hypothetical protein
VYGTDYTASPPAQDDTGGTLTLLTELPAGAAEILIRRKTPATQEIDLHDNSRLRAKTIEDMADKVTMEAQEIKNMAATKDDLQDILGEANVAVETEKEQRIGTDDELNQKIETETQEREEADGTLDRKIETETAAREAAQEQEVTDRDAAIERAMDMEAAARDAAVAAERTQRRDADSALGGKIRAETAERKGADSKLNKKILKNGAETAKLQAFHAWNAEAQYAPFSPVFYLGYPYYANPGNMPLAGQNPIEYPAKWTASGNGSGAVTADGIHADSLGNIRLKYFVDNAQYGFLKRTGKLVPGARYIITDKWRLPSVRDFSWMFTRICALLAAVPKEKTRREDADSELDGKIEAETAARKAAVSAAESAARAMAESRIAKSIFAGTNNALVADMAIAPETGSLANISKTLKNVGSGENFTINVHVKSEGGTIDSAFTRQDEHNYTLNLEASKPQAAAEAAQAAADDALANAASAAQGAANAQHAAEAAQDTADGKVDADYVGNAVAQAQKVPGPPGGDGVYSLKCVVQDGSAVYLWQQDGNGT